MEHCEVGVGAFLPAGEDAAEAVEPGVGALDDPAAGAEAGLAFDRLCFFAAAADVGREAELVEQFADLVVVVATVEAEPLRPLGCRRGPLDRDRLNRLACQLEVVAVRARGADPDRDALSLGEDAPFRPLAECGSSCQGGGGRHRVVGAVVAARGSSLSLVRGRGAGDMMVDGGSRGRAVSGRPVFCGQRVAGALAWHGAFGSRPEGVEGRIDDVMDAGAASPGQLGVGSSAASPTATSAW